MSGLARVVQDCRRAMFRPPGDRWEREKLFARVRNYSIRTQFVSWNIAAPLALYLFGDSDLNHFISQDQSQYNVLFHLLQLISITFYFIASLIDPGYIERVPNNKYQTHNHNNNNNNMPEEEVGLLSSNINNNDISDLSPKSLLNNPKLNQINNVSIEMTQTNNNNTNVQGSSTIHTIPTTTTTNSNDSKSRVIENEVFYVNSENPPGNFCFRCEFIRPIRSKHCYDCDRCTMKFDHHCPMVANCVGGKNHRFFLCFISFETIVVLWAFFMAVKTLFKLSLIFGHSHKDLEESSSRSPIGWVFRVILFITMFFALFVVAGLAGFHWYLALTNQTTYEMIKPTLTERYLDDRSAMLKNQKVYKQSKLQTTNNNNNNKLQTTNSKETDTIGLNDKNMEKSIANVLDPTSLVKTMTNETKMTEMSDNLCTTPTTSTSVIKSSVVMPGTVQYLQQRVTSGSRVNSDNESKNNTNNNMDGNENSKDVNKDINNNNGNGNSEMSNVNIKDGNNNNDDPGGSDEYYTSDSSIEDFGMRKPGHRPARPGTRRRRRNGGGRGGGGAGGRRNNRRRGHRVRNKFDMYFSKGICGNVLSFFGADLEDDWIHAKPCIITSK